MYRIDASTYADAHCGTLPRSQTAQSRAVCAGTELGYEERRHVTAVGAEGPYRLGVYHAGGAIVEYFHSVVAALQRERELEVLFTGSRATYEPVAMAVGR